MRGERERKGETGRGMESTGGTMHLEVTGRRAGKRRRIEDKRRLGECDLALRDAHSVVLAALR